MRSARKRRVRSAWKKFCMVVLCSAVLCFLILVAARGNMVVFFIVILIFPGFMFGAARIFLVHLSSGAIPVLNYHSVSDNPSWMRNGAWISIGPRLFEKHLRFLSSRGYIALTVAELFDRWDELHKNTSKRYVVLIFDDGFRDNWTTVFPLLKQYGMKATVFITTGFIGNDNSETSGSEGYLNWQQCRVMEQSGLIDFQSHGVTHSRLFSDARLLGYVVSGYENIWLFLNRFPERSPIWWRHKLDDDRLLGYPLFSQQPALTVRAYIPDEQWVRRLNRTIVDFYQFELPRNMTITAAIRRCEEVTSATGIQTGRYETEGEYYRRVHDELCLSREEINRRLNKECRFFCWPENAYTPELLSIASSCGYEATVSNFFDSVNDRNDYCATIGRVFIGSRFTGIENNTLDLTGFVATLQCFQGNYVWYPIIAGATLLRRLLMRHFSRDNPFIPAQDRQPSRNPCLHGSTVSQKVRPPS